MELYRAGRKFSELAREFEPSEQTIRTWVKQADLDAGRRTDGVTTQERDELRRLRRENRTLKLQREILKKALPGLLGRPERCPRGIRIREGESGHLSRCRDVSSAGRLPQRLLCVA